MTNADKAYRKLSFKTIAINNKRIICTTDMGNSLHWRIHTNNNNNGNVTCFETNVFKKITTNDGMTNCK